MCSSDLIFYLSEEKCHMSVTFEYSEEKYEPCVTFEHPVRIWGTEDFTVKSFSEVIQEFSSEVLQGKSRGQRFPRENYDTCIVILENKYIKACQILIEMERLLQSELEKMKRCSTYLLPVFLEP